MTGWEVGYLILGLLIGGTFGSLWVALLVDGARCGVDRDG